MGGDVLSEKGLLEWERSWARQFSVLDTTNDFPVCAAVRLFSLAQTLGEWLIEEPAFLHGVDDQVRGLQDELNRLRCFLKDADAKAHESERVRNWVAEIRDAAYDAEDVIETFILKIKARAGRGVKGILKRSAYILDEAVTRHKVGSRVKDITARLSKIAESMRNYGIREAMDRENTGSSRERLERRQSFSYVVECNVVGLERSTEELVTCLVDGRRQFIVISICGMGGLGKTMLAKQVFHHETVRRYYDRFAWVCVTHDCNRRYLWQEILLNLGSKDDRHRILHLRDEELAEELYQFLKTNKCLVVLDDIWTTEAWDRIKQVFSQHETGSKIILTSRNKDLASYVDPRGILYEPKCLNHEKSWELLRRIAFSKQYITEPRVYGRLEELGEQMVKHCGGLPLAITVLGGLLTTKNTLDEWQKVYEDIKSYIRKGSGHHRENNLPVFDVLSLSYEDLPPHLKHCFLYFAHFPEDYRIPIGKLLSYWIDEGIVTPVNHGQDDVTVEDVAQGYLEELVKRSLVLFDLRYTASSYFRTCYMHDIMREVCLQKAGQERFVRVIDPQHQDENGSDKLLSSIGKFRRVAMHLEADPDKSEADIFHQKNIESCHLRSFFQVVKPLYYGRVLLGPIEFKNMKLLRSLELQQAHIEGGELSKDIGELIHLRCLSLRHTNVTKLPSALGRLKLMQTLDLYIDLAPVYIPNVIWKMRRLRHLFLPSQVDAKTKLDLATLSNLQTLWDFHVGSCNPRDIMNMKGLRRLSISLSSTKIDLTEIYALSNVLKRLRGLTIKVPNDNLLPAPVDITQMISAFVDLSELELSIRFVKLPEAHQFSPNISTLLFERFCGIEEDPFPVLEKLPNLRILLLCERSFIGKKLVCSKDGFPQLHILRLCEQESLEEWTVDDGAMPCVSFVEINYCKKLKMLPDGFKCLKTLRELEVRKMNKVFKDNLVPGGEDFCKVEHIPYVMFEQCDD